MDRFLEAEYNQFIIVGGIVLVFIILYMGYKHYMKQQYIENVPNKLNGAVSSSPMNQQKSILIFIPRLFLAMLVIKIFYRIVYFFYLIGITLIYFRAL